MSSDSSVAIPALLCHVAQICWARKSRAVYIYLRGRPHVLIREKAVLLRQRRYLSYYDNFEYFSEYVKEGQ